MTDATRTPTTALAAALHIVNGPPPGEVEDFPGWEEDWADELAAELAKQGVILVDREALAAALYERHKIAYEKSAHEVGKPLTLRSWDDPDFNRGAPPDYDIREAWRKEADALIRELDRG